MIVLPVLVVLTMCTPWFLGGAERHRGPVPETHVPPLVAPECRLPDGTTEPGSTATYYVLPEATGYSLLEKNPDGPSSRIVNHRRTKDGLHFAAWVDGGKAYYFFISTDPSTPSMRYVYTDYTLQEDGGFTRFEGTAAVACPMALVPTDASVPLATSVPSTDAVAPVLATSSGANP